MLNGNDTSNQINNNGSKKKKNLNVRIYEDELTLVKDAAAEQNMSLSEYVRERITNGVDGIRLNNKQAILSPLVILSNNINELEESEAKEEMKRANMKIWRLLADQIMEGQE